MEKFTVLVVYHRLLQETLTDLIESDVSSEKVWTCKGREAFACHTVDGNWLVAEPFALANH
eukprot:4545161-Ditylum_brightwellii.AAC.2